MPVKDLTRQRFGKLLVKKQASYLENDRRARWKCVCDCGNIIIVRSSNLIQGLTFGCGCNKITHGQYQSRTYNSWSTMIQRCTNPKASNYKAYGKRGITVCKRWRVFENFLEDMGERPSKKTLERRDVDGNYTKKNCKWATDIEQNNNRRANHNQHTAVLDD